MNDPKIIRLKQEVGMKRQLLSELRTGLDEFSGEYIPQKQIPSVAIHYLDITSELEMQKSIYNMLRKEYEAVKIEEYNNARTFQIIEPAEVPEKKAGPSRATICIIVTITAFILSAFWALLKEYRDKIKQDPVESKKLENIKSLLLRRYS